MEDRKILFKVQNLKKYFPIKKKWFTDRQQYVHANENISINIYEGETLGLVGESGSGKSTFGRTIIQLHSQTEGNTLYYGNTVENFAPEYIGKMIDKIPSLYPAYKTALKELDDLYAARDKEENDDKRYEIEDKLMYKRREIQNKYLAMVRHAGGLLLHKDLNKVSKVLKEQFAVNKKYAETLEDINLLDLKLNDSEYAKKKDKLQSERDALATKLVEIEKQLAEENKKVAAVKAEVEKSEEFDRLESQLDDGIDLSNLTEREMRRLRKDLQIIFQDPYSSLDTKFTVGNIIGEGVMAHDMFKSHNSEGYDEYIKSVMNQCGLSDYFIHRYPHQFSGGQRQRIGIARALALQPKFIVCDESVSALDVSIQSQVINLLQDLRVKNNLTYLFITHDLSVVKYISDRIAVMYLGNVVELAETEKIFDEPLHPYTSALLNAIPRTDVDSNQTLSILEGDVPSAVNPPEGCRFHTRCKYCFDRCEQFEPPLHEWEPDHFVACHLMDMEESERQAYMTKIDQEEEKRLREQEKALSQVAKDFQV